jgi:hypothetical protein
VATARYERLIKVEAEQDRSAAVVRWRKRHGSSAMIGYGASVLHLWLTRPTTRGPLGCIVRIKTR